MESWFSRIGTGLSGSLSRQLTIGSIRPKAFYSCPATLVNNFRHSAVPGLEFSLQAARTQCRLKPELRTKRPRTHLCQTTQNEATDDTDLCSSVVLVVAGLQSEIR